MGQQRRSIDFSRYALTAASVGLATTAQADFSSPYQLTPPAAGNHSVSNSNISFGAWTAVSTLATGANANTSSAPSSLLLGLSNGTVGAGNEQFNFNATVQGSGPLSFNWSFTTNGLAPTQFGYTVNGAFTSLATTNANGLANISVNAGDVFGFRLFANYNGSDSVTISNFSAPVPEPSIAMLVAAGVVALFLLRERRRRIAK
jgi:MYXO-CTERM domain-containing protein